MSRQTALARKRDGRAAQEELAAARWPAGPERQEAKGPGSITQPRLRGQARTRRARGRRGEPRRQRHGTCGGGVEEAMDQPQVKLSFAVSLFHCRACARPLRPPTFKCEAGHLVCGGCRGIHGQACDRAATVVASPDVDVYVRSARLPCANAEFGCESFPVYYQAADHERACHWAPCRCPDPACDASTSPARLLAHFAGRHSWPVTGVSYAKPHRIALPPPPRGLHFLVAKDDGRVFLVSTSALGAAASAVAASTGQQGALTLRPH